MSKEIYSFQIRRAHLTEEKQNWSPGGTFHSAEYWQAWPWRPCKGRCSLPDLRLRKWEGREKTVSNGATGQGCNASSWHPSHKVPRFWSGSRPLNESQPLRRTVPTSPSHCQACLPVQSPVVCPHARVTQAWQFPSGHMQWLPQASVCVPFPQTKCLLLFFWCPQTCWNWPTAYRSSFWSQRTWYSLFLHLVGECEGPSGLGMFGSEVGFLRLQCSFYGSGCLMKLHSRCWQGCIIWRLDQGRRVCFQDHVAAG